MISTQLNPDFISGVQIGATLLLIAFAMVCYATERLSVELTSLVVLSLSLLVFQLFPVPTPDGSNRLDPEMLLSGFANPGLITLLALLVVGQGIIRTGMLGRAAHMLLRLGRGQRVRSLISAFCGLFGLSALLNNTPVVVMFIPVMEILSRRLSLRPSSLLMPTSFVAILAGMTTLIGTSTNLMVSGALVQAGQPRLRFFDFFVPGLFLAGVGLVYLAVMAPRLLAARDSAADRLVASPRRRFIMQGRLAPNDEFAGHQANSHLLDVLGTRLILVQRGNRAFVPPWRGCVLEPGDDVVILTSRAPMEEVRVRYPRLFGVENPNRASGSERVLAEVMVAPGSRVVGQTLEELAFHTRFGCIVLGIERGTRMIPRRVTDIPLRAGDVLVIEGMPEDVERLRTARNLLVLDGSVATLPAPALAGRAALILAGVVGAAASGLLPIAVAAVSGATLMIWTGVLSVERAVWALDRRLVLLIGTSFALGAALEHSGTARLFAQGAIEVLGLGGPIAVLSGLFFVVALATNVVSNNAAAILFTPIAIETAEALQADPFVFALAVLFGANCSFATPISYQTNLLVMAPGHYRFADFVKLGAPLVLLLWLAFSVFAPWYFGLV